MEGFQSITSVIVVLCLCLLTSIAPQQFHRDGLRYFITNVNFEPLQTTHFKKIFRFDF